MGDENDYGRRGEKVLRGGQQGDLALAHRPLPERREVPGLGSRQLRREAIIVVQAVEHRPCNEPAVGGLGCCELRVRVGDAVNALVDASSVEPADVLGQDGPQLPLVPDEDPVEQLAAQGADEALDMRLCVWRMVRRGDPTEVGNWGRGMRRTALVQGMRTPQGGRTSGATNLKGRWIHSRGTTRLRRGAGEPESARI